MPSLILVFLMPLLAGFILNRSAHELRNASAHESGYGSVLMALITGLILIVFSNFYLIGVQWVLSLNPSSKVSILITNISAFFATPIVELIDNLAAADNLDTPIINAHVAALSFYLALFASVLCRLNTKRNEYFRELHLHKAHKWYGGPLETLLAEAKSNKLPLLITLKTRKVYIGYVQQLSSFYPHHKTNHIRLSILASGYRDEKTLSFVITNKYDFIQSIPHAFKEYLSRLQEEKIAFIPENILVEGELGSIEVSQKILSSIYDEGLVIDLSEIASATVWSEEIYSLFIKPENPHVIKKIATLVKEELKQKAGLPLRAS